MVGKLVSLEKKRHNIS